MQPLGTHSGSQQAVADSTWGNKDQMFRPTAPTTTPLTKNQAYQSRLFTHKAVHDSQQLVLLLQTLPAFIFTTACPIYYPQRISRSCTPASGCGPTTLPCPRTWPLKKKKKKKTQLPGAAQMP